MSDWFDGAGNGSAVDVAALLDGNGAVEALAAMVQEGALVSIGRTSDGGAVSVTVTLDGRWRREYFRSVEDLLPWLGAALDAVRSAPKPPASSGRQSRKRGL